MGKTRSWMNYVKRLFTPNSKPKSQEKSSNWGRAVNKKLKFRRRSYYLAAEESPGSTLTEAAEEHRKQAVAVAVATAAAAEAAIAAANAAVEVVRLANAPYGAERRISFSAAVKIQTAYRRHLARKALSALKGIVKLQAVVRGGLARKNISFLVSPTRVKLEEFKDRNSTAVETSRLAKLKLGTTQKNGTTEESRKSTSFCNVKHKSTEENVASLPNSPGYMAATECTKARLRSLSTPRQRLRLCETYSGRDYKFGLLSGHSFNGEIIARTHRRNSDF